MNISYFGPESICREDSPMSPQLSQSKFSGSTLRPEKIEPVHLEQHARGGVQSVPGRSPCQLRAQRTRNQSPDWLLPCWAVSSPTNWKFSFVCPYTRLYTPGGQRPHLPCSYQSFAATPTHRSFSIIIYECKEMKWLIWKAIVRVHPECMIGCKSAQYCLPFTHAVPTPRLCPGSLGLQGWQAGGLLDVLVDDRTRSLPGDSWKFIEVAISLVLGCLTLWRQCEADLQVAPVWAATILPSNARLNLWPPRPSVSLLFLFPKWGDYAALRTSLHSSLFFR